MEEAYIPKAIVVVPVYNTAAYLDRCVESLVRQSYAQCSIWLVDDGSPDEAPRLCDAWAERDARIHVIHQKNGGLSAARNAALNHCEKGDYLFFVDSDDYLAPETIERCIVRAEETGADMVVYNRVELAPKGQTIHAREVEDDTSAAEVWSAIVERRMYPQVCGKCFRMRSWGDLRFQEGILFEDLYSMPDVLLRHPHITCIAYEGYMYDRSNPHSIMNRIGSRFSYYEFNGMERFLDKLQSSMTRSQYLQTYQYTLQEALRAVLRDVRYRWLTPVQRAQCMHFIEQKDTTLPYTWKVQKLLWRYRVYRWLHLL